MKKIASWLKKKGWKTLLYTMPCIITSLLLNSFLITGLPAWTRRIKWVLEKPLPFVYATRRVRRKEFKNWRKVTRVPFSDWTSVTVMAPAGGCSILSDRTPRWNLHPPTPARRSSACLPHQDVTSSPSPLTPLGGQNSPPGSRHDVQNKSFF